MEATNGIDELFIDTIEHCSKVKEELLRAIAGDGHDSDVLHQQVGSVMCMVDYLIEHGILDPKLLQDVKINKRISFIGKRKFNVNRARVIPSL